MGTKVANEVVGLNQSVIIGEIVREPERRTLPSGSEAVSFPVTVRVEGEKTSSVPVVWYDPPKRLNRWKLGDSVIVSGTVTRRFYRGGRGLGSTTEVVVTRAELTAHVSKAQRLLDDAQAQVERAAESIAAVTG